MSVVLVAQTAINGLMLSMIYALVALGLTLVYSVMRILNFAHGQLYMLGGFLCFYLYSQWHLNFFATLIISMITMAVVGFILEKAFFRHLRGNLLNSLLVALGLSTFIEHASLLGFGIYDKHVPSVFKGVLTAGGIHISSERLAVILIAAVLFTLLILFMKLTKTGQAMIAVAEDSEAAALQGISVDRINWQGMALGSALAAAAGVLIAPVFYVNTSIGGEVIIKAFLIITLGGLGSIGGAAIGALALGFVESFASTLLGATAASFASLALIFVVLLIKPSGFFGHED